MSDGNKKVFNLVNTPDDQKFSVKHSLTPEAVSAIISKTALEAEKDPVTKDKMDQFVYWFDGWSKNKAGTEFMKEFIKDHKPYLDDTFGYTSEKEFTDFWYPKLDRIADAYKKPLQLKEQMSIQDSAAYHKTLEGTGLDYPDLHDYFLYSKNYRGPRKRRGAPFKPYSEFKLQE